jgi:hypothetical protein
MRTLRLRLMRLEGAAIGLAPSYVVRLPAEAMEDGEAEILNLPPLQIPVLSVLNVCV